MMLARRTLLAASLTGAGIYGPPLARPAAGQNAWPTGEPIKIIVAYPPGGGTDLAARGMIPYLERAMPGARFVVVNRPGATGELGHAALAAAPRDGYTFGLVVTPSLQTVTIERTPRYRIEDFTFLGGTTEDPGAFYVKKDSPIRNLRDLAERAKAAPDTVSVATSGVGSDDHLLMLDFQHSAGVRMVHVPFAGQAPTVTALMAGHVDVAAMNVAEGLPGVRDGLFLCLAQASSERGAMAADTPTFKESGFDVVGVVTRGFAVPNGTPATVVARLSEAIAAAMRDPGWRADAERMTLPLRYWSAAEYTQYVAEQDSMLRKRWQERPWGSN
jgi:tripartite-type tricarboxylate transporter receptor subunit TctC